MRHALGDVTFEAPDALGDFSDYSYEAPDRSAAVVVQVAGDEQADAEGLLANARARFEGIYGPLIVYRSPVTFRRGDGAGVPGVEGEQRDMNHTSRRIRFAIAAVARDRAKAVILYNGPAGPDALDLVRRIVRTVFFVGDALPPRSLPARWRWHQAGAIVLAVPAGWTAPRTLVFRSDAELCVTLAEPAAAEGAIDLETVWPDARPRVASARTERVSSPVMAGWLGEWRLEDAGDRARAIVVRKLSVELAPGLVVTAYGKAPVAAAPALDEAWRTMQGSLRVSGGVR
ncbi:MAG TPA: hypothetical protein VE987_03390 [Polyangiaceae bacterium]|nr:hypothetical protein [Polyangiaceae bacterium]